MSVPLRTVYFSSKIHCFMSEFYLDMFTWKKLLIPEMNNIPFPNQGLLLANCEQNLEASRYAPVRCQSPWKLDLINLNGLLVSNCHSKWVSIPFVYSETCFERSLAWQSPTRLEEPHIHDIPGRITMSLNLSLHTNCLERPYHCDRRGGLSRQGLLYDKIKSSLSWLLLWTWWMRIHCGNHMTW